MPIDPLGIEKAGLDPLGIEGPIQKMKPTESYKLWDAVGASIEPLTLHGLAMQPLRAINLARRGLGLTPYAEQQVPLLRDDLFQAHPTPQELASDPSYAWMQGKTPEQIGAYSEKLAQVELGQRTLGMMPGTGFFGGPQVPPWMLQPNFGRVVPSPQNVPQPTGLFPNDPMFEGLKRDLAIAGGVAEPLNEFAAQMTTPEGVAMVTPFMASGPLAPLARAVIAADMASHVPENIQQRLQQVEESPDAQTIAKYFVGGALDAGIPLGIVKHANQPVTKQGVFAEHISQGSPEFPFLMPNRPAIPMEDRPNRNYQLPIIGERPVTIEQQVLSPYEAKPIDPLQIEKGVGFAGEPKQGEQLPISGQEFTGNVPTPGFAKTAEQKISSRYEPYSTVYNLESQTSTPLTDVESRIRESLKSRDWESAVIELAQQPAEVSRKLADKLLGTGKEAVPISAGEKLIFNELWDKAVQIKQRSAALESMLSEPKTGKVQSGITPEELRKRLVPAINLGGKILSGRQGDTHADVLEANGLDSKAFGHSDPARGFYDPETKQFYSRFDAQKATGLEGKAQAGGLDSLDLPGAAQMGAMRKAGFSDSEIGMVMEGEKLRSGLGDFETGWQDSKEGGDYWLLPNGQPRHAPEGHVAEARNLLRLSSEFSEDRITERARQANLLRVVESPEAIYFSNRSGHVANPSRLQMQELKNRAIETGKKLFNDKGDVVFNPKSEESGLYSGIPIFDENLWGSKEEAKRAKELFSKRLAKTDPQAAERLNQAVPVKPTGDRTKDILSNPNANPINRREEIIAQPGKRLGVGDRFTNFKNKAINIANETDKILNPWDVIFDYLDGGKAQFKGPLMENIRKPLDDAWNDHANSYHFYTDPIRDLARKHKMGEQASSRIGVYLTAQQEGGLQKMIESGISRRVITDTLSSIKPEELEVAKAMRKAYDELAPQIQRVAKATDDVEVKIPSNYAPLAREWRKYKPEPDELAKPELGKSASIDDLLWPKLKIDQKVKTDSFSIFDRWIKDATHYIASRQLLKDSAKIVNDPKFESKYGKMGQELMTEFLNNYARQGRYKSNQLLDALRRATSRGVVGFRLPSQLVHMANIPLAMTHTGPLWWNKALNEVFTDDGQNFLRKHFAESFERGGGEPALTELQQTEAGRESLLTKATKAGFAGQRFIDRYVTQAAILGAYMKELNRKGLSAVDYSSLPFDKDAARQARVLARRAVASPLYKDVPPALTRGGSLSKAFFQFQNTFLDQWSNIRYEFAQIGIPEAFKGNPKLLAGMLFGLAGMFAVETSVKHGYKVAKKALAGNEKEEEDEYQKELLYEMSRRVPGAGQLQSSVMYGATGIPAVDVALEIPKELYKTAKADEPAAKALHSTRALGAVGELAIPGASQLTDVASALEQRHFFKPHEKRLEEATGKKVSQMSLSERVKAEKDFKATSEKLSPESKAKSAERSIANITKRGEELSKLMTKADRQWMESRGLNVPGFDNKIHAGKTLVYLTKDEMERLSKYTLEAYNEAMPEIRQTYPQLNTQQQDVYFNSRMNAAKGKARARLITELNSKNESNQRR